MSTNTYAQKIHFTLRVATACCFIGHGVFGVITKAVWCNYFALFGIGTSFSANIDGVKVTGNGIDEMQQRIK